MPEVYSEFVPGRLLLFNGAKHHIYICKLDMLRYVKCVARGSGILGPTGYIYVRYVAKK